MPVVALAAIYWKVQDNKFPYVGTWVHNLKTRDGSRVEIFVTFATDGKFTPTFIHNGRSRTLPCSYTMQGNNAIILVKSATLQRAGRTCDSFVRSKLVPQQNGNILLHYTLRYWVVEQETGKLVEEKNYPGLTPLYTYRRVAS